MSKRNRRLRRKRISNLVIAAVLVVFLIVVYRFGFSTKTESTDIALTAVFSERGSENTALASSLIIEQDDEGSYYVVLPEKVQTYKPIRYIKTVENIATNSSNTEENDILEVPENTVEETNTIIPNTIDNEIEVENVASISTENIAQENVIIDDEIPNTIEENTISNTIDENANVVENDDFEQEIINEVENEVVEETSSEEEKKQEEPVKVVEETIQEEPIKVVEEIMIEEPEKSTIEYEPFSKYYLSEEEYENRVINLEIIHNTKSFIMQDGSIGKLYNQEIEKAVLSTGTIVSITGYLPYASTVNLTDVKSTVESYIVDDEEYENTELLLAYDISIVDSVGNEYQPEDYSDSVQVKIKSETEFDRKLSTNKVLLKHFVVKELEGEYQLIDENVAVISKEEDSIDFITNEFSPYAIFSVSSISGSAVNIYDYDSDYSYYIGQNFTENGTGRTGSNVYSNDNLGEVTINYYGYDYNESIEPEDKYFDTATWSSTTPTPVYESVPLTEPDYILDTLNIPTNSITWTRTNYGGSWQAGYYAEITIRFTSTDSIDMNQSWNVSYTIPGYYYYSHTDTVNYNTGMTLSRSGSMLTMSGNSMTSSGWTKTGNNYSLVFRLYYTSTTGRNNASTKPTNITANVNYHKALIGYSSTFTAVISSPDFLLDMSSDWTMQFEVPNAGDFDDTRLNSDNTGKTFTKSMDTDTSVLTLTGSSMEAAGWVYNKTNSTYTFSLTVFYSSNTSISNLPNQFLFRAKTLPVVGYISADSEERQNVVTYIKCVPIQNGNVSIELIDNPFMDRPAERGFNGWTTHESGYTFSMNSQTYVQTLTTSIDTTTKTATINVYANWSYANIVFLNTNSTNGNGLSISTPANSLASAASILDSNYVNASNASNRELNIIVFTGGTVNGFNTSYAHTFTSLYNGVDYRTSATVNLSNSYSYSVSDDIQLDYLNFTGSNNYTSSTTTGTINRYLYGNGRNVRIGRGMMPSGATDTNTVTTFAQVQGLGTSNVSRSYRLVIESGKYANLHLASTSSNTLNGDATLVLGCDYDRIQEKNTNLYVYNRCASRSGSGTMTGDNQFVFTINVKSGNIGRSYFDLYKLETVGTYDDDNFAFAGIYVGGHSSGTDTSDRRIIVEGGDIANILGGLAVQTSNSTIKTYIYMKGGSVQSIVGGAGISTTRGDRIIQVTGGEVAYCIAGGSNGFSAGITSGSTNPTGQLDGNTLVYVGGNAKIGTAGVDNTLYNANAGSVFGAGYGNDGLNTSGQVYTSHVIINENAEIYNSVYGGGNYGVTGTANVNGTAKLATASTIDILGGTIKDSVYGGANSNGTVTNAQTIKGSTVINMKNGTVEGTIYGGCNSSGTVSGATDINITGGTIGVQATNGDIIFGGGKGSDTSVRQATTINITDENNSVNLYGSVYGGSALGSVQNNSTVTIKDYLSASNAITSTGDVYGGGKGDASNSASTGGNVLVTIDGGSYPNTKAYGGCNVNGTIAGTVLVKIGENNNTLVNEVYGGGNQAVITTATDSVNVYIHSNGTVNNVFNGGNNAGIDGNNTRALYVQGGTVNQGAYGGSNSAGTLSYTYVECTNGATVGNVYGGGKGDNTLITGNTEVIINASTITDSVYGGGEGTSAATGNKAAVNGNSTVNISNGSTVGADVYGGGNAGILLGNTDIDIDASIVSGSVYGGGKGPTATVSGYTDIDITNGTTIAVNVYGGGNAGALTKYTDVYIDESTVTGNVYGGGKGSTATVGENTKVLIEDSNITNTNSEYGNVYGGGDAGLVSGTSTVSIASSTVSHKVYGGGNEADVIGNTNVSLSNTSSAESVYGGGNQGKIGSNTTTSNTAVSIDSSSVTDTVYGGGNQGLVTGDTYVYSLDSTVTNSIFGGGKAANVGSTVVTILNSSDPTGSTTKNVYGGGDQGEVTGTTIVTITRANIENKVYGGGNGADNQTGTTVPGKVAGNTTVTLTNSKAGTVFGGGNGVTALVGGNTKTLIINSEMAKDESDSISGFVFGGGNNGTVAGSTIVGLTNATIAESAYAAGNGASANVQGNAYIYAEGTTTIGDSIFGGGNAAVTGDTAIPTPDNDDNHPYESSYVTAIVDIAGAVIGGNVYGGANSSVIQGNTVVNIGIKAIEEFYESSEGSGFTPGKDDFTKGKIDISGTVFGGGESMDPTKPFSYDTVSVLGTVLINVNGEGYDTDENTTIEINKSIFGSGNASRSTGRTRTISIKNYGTTDEPKKGVSLQRATDVVINNSALWLSGTTDSTSAHPDGYFTLNQITSTFKLKNNSTLYLRNGANKVHSFYSLTADDQIAAVKIVDTVTGENGTTYNVINGKVYDGETEKFYIEDEKVYNSETLEEVTTVASIEYATTFEKNVDNRLYMYSAINLNISDDEDVSSQYGEVYGMTFFGLYRSIGSESEEESGGAGEETGAGTEFDDGDTSEYDVALYKGMYDKDYTVGGAIDWIDRDYSRSYVLGLHKTSPEHDIVKDGFYTVYEKFGVEIPNNVTVSEENYSSFNPISYISYITPTPENDLYYMWYAGPDQDIYYYTFNLTASKYSTLGTKEISLTGLSFPNATITMSSVESTLNEGIGLYDKNTIPNINPDQAEANKRFGISMKSSNSGWSMVGTTDFYSDPENNNAASYEGTEVYKLENSTTTPTMSFFFYHSNNISETQELGYYTIKMRLMYQKDALNKGYADVIFDIVLLTEVYEDVGFNGAITPGAQYDLFTTTTTNITTVSSFSTYFELAEDKFFENESVQNFYDISYRVITTEYALPLNTTITMIDRHDHTSPKYYYYIVTQADVNNHKNEFRLTDFTVMGSTNEKYDEVKARDEYFLEDISYEYENYIFITSFENAVFTETPDENNAIVTDQHFRIYLKADIDGRSEILFGLLDEQIESLKYGIYDSESTIDIDAALTKNKIYLGNEVFLNVNTNYDVTVTSGSRVYDTRFFDKKLGIKLSFYYQNDDGDWEIVSGAELLGLYFELDGIKYYPSADGTTRIRIADLVSNASSSIKIGTENSSIDSNYYRIKVESFGSADGLYYGIYASDSDLVYLEIINDVFGLDVKIEEQQAIIDSATGKVLDKTENRIGYLAPEEHKLNFTVDYLSGLSNPYITISLYRRTYDGVYDNEYEKVDLQDYVTETLDAPTEYDSSVYTSDSDREYLDSIKQFENEYKAYDTATIKAAVGENTTESHTFDDLELTLKDTGLTTGTYKIEFSLYDTYTETVTNVVEEGGTNVAHDYDRTYFEFIGESYTYIIIK